MRMELIIRFDYGSIVPVGAARSTAASGAIAGPGRRCARTPVPSRAARTSRTVAEFTVGQGERVPFVLTWHPSHEPPRRHRSTRRGASTRPRRGGATGRRAAPTRAPWRDAVRPLADHPQGADLRADRRHRRRADHVAARAASAASATGTTATAGCATPTFTLYALIIGGYTDEAAAWRDWLLRAVAGDPPDLQIMYGVARRAPADRVGAAVAARLRGLEAGAHRQRRRRAVPARRLRRGDGRAAPGAARGLDADDASLLDVERTLLEFLETALAGARRRHLGGARPAAALHPFEGDGVGRVRPRASRPSSDFGLDGPVERWRQLRDADPRRGLRARLRRRPQHVRPALRLARRSTPAC